MTAFATPPLPPGLPGLVLTLIFGLLSLVG